MKLNVELKSVGIQGGNNSEFYMVKNIRLI